MKKILAALIPVMLFSGCFSVPYLKNAKVMHIDEGRLNMQAQYSWFTRAADPAEIDTVGEVYFGFRKGLEIAEIGTAADLFLFEGIFNFNFDAKLKLLEWNGYYAAADAFYNPRYREDWPFTYEGGYYLIVSREFEWFCVSPVLGWSTSRDGDRYGNTWDVNYVNYGLLMSADAKYTGLTLGIIYKKGYDFKYGFQGQTKEQDLMLVCLGIDLEIMKQ